MLFEYFTLSKLFFSAYFSVIPHFYSEEEQKVEFLHRKMMETLISSLCVY